MHNEGMRKGQALVIVLMVLAVSTAVGLSVISRTTTEVTISNVQQESARALSAAETGIEKVISGDISTAPITTSDGSFQLVNTPAPFGNDSNLVLPEEIKSGESTILYLVSNYQDTTTYNTAYTNDFYVCWGDPTAAENAAIQMDLYYYRGGSYLISSRGFDVDAGVHNNGFTPGPFTGLSNCPLGRTFEFIKRIAFIDFPGYVSTDTPLIVRFKLLYNGSTDQYIGLRAVTGTFTAQGNTYSVRGTSGSASRRIEFDQRQPEPLPIFDNALFSGGNITIE